MKNHHSRRSFALIAPRVRRGYRSIDQRMSIEGKNGLSRGSAPDRSIQDDPARIAGRTTVSCSPVFLHSSVISHRQHSQLCCHRCPRMFCDPPRREIDSRVPADTSALLQRPATNETGILFTCDCGSSPWNTISSGQIVPFYFALHK
ncbi:uncharacterized protein LOC143362524 [Halictus rubicundus]|uniref:uncharacterized protein LOC143362524 n=1 Tax=Halictus rubicundus TaxID=77578 RepID=UPI0040371F3C